MKTTLEHFKSFAKIPRCSFEAFGMRDFLADFAMKLGFDVKIDKAGNILCRKKKPVLCLQSHYDMVCLGDAPNVEIIEKDGFLSAKNSTLGADNGIGVALMMSMMERFDEVECLFSADEEVGLLGANGFADEIIAPFMLNLDSEEEGAIFIGCAGGAEIEAKAEPRKIAPSPNFRAYEVSVEGLLGGHSGVDIDKNIPNAIKVLSSQLYQNGCEIVNLSGGERINSIPKAARAVVFAPFAPKECAFKSLECQSGVLENSKPILAMIEGFSQGVREYNDELQIPNTSINLSMIKCDENGANVRFFARSMQNENLKNLCDETVKFLQNFGFQAEIKSFEEAWQPTVTPFAKSLLRHARQFYKNPQFKAIHAGLECGIFERRQKNLQVASIGPNIYFPHSLRESCEIASVVRLEKMVGSLIEELR